MTLFAVLFARYILLPVCIVFFLKFASLYPEVQVQRPGMMISLLTGGGEGQAEPGEPGGEAEAPTDEGAPRAGVAPPAAAESPPLRFPVIEADPRSPREGEAWINRRDGRLKVWMSGRLHVMAVTTGRLVSPLPDLPRQVKFAALVGLGVVVAFHLPVLMLVIGWTGLVDPGLVAKQRKYAVFGCFALGAVLTPADLMSMFVLAGPMYGLFEFGLLLMRWVDRGPSEPDDREVSEG